MNIKPFLYAALVFLVISLSIGLYILSADPEGNLFAFKIGAFYAFLALALIFWLTAGMFKKLFLLTSDISRKYEGIERLLLDLRDGTREFYKEKRKFVRVNVEGKVSARITGGEKPGEFVKILDLSKGGACLKARLRTAKAFKQGEIIGLEMYLPLFPQPVDVGARVTWARPASPAKKSKDFIVGIEFVDMDAVDRRKLVETINMFRKTRG